MNFLDPFRLRYISKLEFIFKPDRVCRINRKTQVEQKFLESLPYLVKHSLFLDSDILTKLRNLGDVGQLFFITDDTKIKGNKAYERGDYYEALDVYEQVLAVFLWLDLKKPELRDKAYEDFNFIGI